MKTANVKVRVSDVKAGVTAYRSHPVYGIEKIVFLSKPYMNKHTNSLFVNVLYHADNWTYKATESLCDAGISPGNSYNGRRTFFKLKQAIEWQKKWAKDLNFIRRQADHEEFCEMISHDWYDDF